MGVVGLACSLLLGCKRVPPTVASAKPPEVIVDTPSCDTVLDFEDFIGRTEGIPYVEVRARVSGELKEPLFQDGAEVKEGDPLFEIDPRTYELEVKRASATLAQAEAKLKGKFALFKIADRLHKDGNKNLSQEDWENAESAYEEAKSERDLAIENKKLAVLNESYCHIAAPINGRASRKKIDKGNLVTANVTMLTTIVALDPIYANFDVDERTLLRLRRLIRKKEIVSARQSKVVVQVGLADEPGFSLSGVVDFAEPALDPGTGTLRVRVHIDNPEVNQFRLLSPNMFVRIRFPVGYPHPALLVPEQALVSDQGIRHLFVLNENNEAKYRPVTLGLQQGEMRVITEGLQANDRVIISGLQRVRPDIKVTPKPAEKRPVVAGAQVNSTKN
jgi:RND family efflux transporter MFP subunit